MVINLPKYVLNAIEILEKNNFEAWCVGGAVRDSIIGLTPGDYDISTNTTPENIVKMFPKTVPTGIKHGTITAIFDEGNIEITTYRSESNYSNHRAPDNVNFETNVNADLSRRDFTMNAICYNPKHGIYDPFCGVADINNKTIRAIGNAENRFNEDALRIMRAFRFAAQLKFTIEKDTLSAALKLSHTLNRISSERIYAELKKILLSENTSAISPLSLYGGLEFYNIPKTDFPAFISSLPPCFPLRVAAFCKYANCNESVILKRLKSEKQTQILTDMYRKLIDFPCPNTSVEIKQMLNFSDYTATKNTLIYHKTIGTNTDAQIIEVDRIIQSNEPYSISSLDITGNDLIDLGIKDKEIGDSLQALLHEAILNPNLNKKELLLKILTNK